MALHGDIKVNDAPILAWVAQRVLNGVDDGPHLYSCLVRVVDGDSPPEPFLIEHHYEDGAVMLAQLVLAHYQSWRVHQ